MRMYILMILIGAMVLGGTSSIYAGDVVNKKPLNEVFDQMVIIPYDYQGKAFVKGQKTDLYEDYSIVERNGRVLVPIRLMGYLATESDRFQSMWQTIWQSQYPDEVLLTNNQLQRTIKFTVNSKTMIVNNQPEALEVAPQNINGRIVLPLRSAATALGKKIDWLDGLIIIGDEYVDLQHPQTLAIKDQIKMELSDTRERVDYNRTVYPITKYGKFLYYYKWSYLNDEAKDVLYKREEGQTEMPVPLLGKPTLASAKIINDELYYVTSINGRGELYALHLADNKSRKISTLDPWSSGDGWVDTIQYIGEDLYINLHTGDWTMGYEHLYKVEHGTLQSVTQTKTLISFVEEDNDIYTTDYRPMSNAANNLSRVNVVTGEETLIGVPGFTYDINRTIWEDGGVSYSYSRVLHIEDGYLYTLGYEESDLKDEGAVYRINLTDQTQVKLTSSTNQFWIVDQLIYYIDARSGHLISVDRNGGNLQTLVERKVLHVEFHQGSIYYTANANKGTSTLGELYKYDIADGQEVKLSEKSVSSFYVGEVGVYYVSKGYDLGLYTIDASGREVRLVDDSIDTAILTDTGIMYTLIYEQGIYAAN